MIGGAGAVGTLGAVADRLAARGRPVGGSRAPETPAATAATPQPIGSPSTLM